MTAFVDRKAGGDLWKSLRRRGKKPNWRGGRHRPRMTSRSAGIVDEKTRIGDWEADDPHIVAQFYLVDRVTKYTLLARQV